MGGDDDGIVAVSSLILGSDGGDRGSLNNLLMCIRRNQGIGSFMSSGSSGTIGGGGIISVRDSLGITESVWAAGPWGLPWLWRGLWGSPSWLGTPGPL